MNLPATDAAPGRVTLSLDAAIALADQALRKTGLPVDAARIVAQALVAADADGLPSHGLARMPFYLAQLHSGKIRAAAVPQIRVAGATVQVDVAHGFAFPAVQAGLPQAMALARELGIAALSLAHSHHFGVAGHPVEQAAREGLIALAFSNAPAAIAPWGGRTPLFGTNPIAFAAPRAQGDPLVVDLSLSKVARGKVMLAQQAGTTIPDDWALDIEGQPTTDPTAAMAGSMLPAGDAKGAALALMLELLCAGLTGSSFAFQANSLFDAEGAPPDIAHLMLLIDPTRFAEGFTDRVEMLCAAMLAQDGVRLPGSRRWQIRAQHQRDGITLPAALVEALRAAG
ncbi:(2R)-3-sulfolactate dehydrogenase (NADP+) [Pseudoxanthomonas sp. GM95]|uniref:Ldh family oxidoreductase n=1 Tax=Pseudoxanthomonas sp. GM95 TaxID=1881043 RepID=UPI0008ACEEE5|nr:Ldh family oxidoreductase [Pseudoxanthomonas sp. GM95]SEL46092.1 (2R)-3-sulfolactate dehydrogenase (NADP+) [Pseudoxanthomonas sp. GM95]